MGVYVKVYSDELAHHGIKGQKWGVRRYQNKDGTLTAAGKKRISKQYKKEAQKAMSDLSKQHEKMYIDAHNKAADYMNRGGIEKFNSEQRKKYGKKYTDRAGYMEDYQKQFEDLLAKNYNTALKDFYDNNDSYKRAKELCDKYGMMKWDDLAKSNEAAIKELSDIVEKY